MAWFRKQIGKLKKVTSDDVPKRKPTIKTTPKPIKKRTGKIVKEHTKFEDE